MVSPRNNWRTSIVAGLRVATELSSDVASSTIRRFGLINIVVNEDFSVTRTRGSSSGKEFVAHDFLVRRMAVETSFSPGCGAAPEGSAMMISFGCVVGSNARSRLTRRGLPRSRDRLNWMESPHIGLLSSLINTIRQCLRYLEMADRQWDCNITYQNIRIICRRDIKMTTLD